MAKKTLSPSTEQRKRKAGHTYISVFEMPNELHNMVTDKQKEVRNKSDKKISIGQSINELLQELKKLKSKNNEQQSSRNIQTT